MTQLEDKLFVDIFSIYPIFSESFKCKTKGYLTSPVSLGSSASLSSSSSAAASLSAPHYGSLGGEAGLNVAQNEGLAALAQSEGLAALAQNEGLAALAHSEGLAVLAQNESLASLAAYGIPLDRWTPNTREWALPVPTLI